MPLKANTAQALLCAMGLAATPFVHAAAMPTHTRFDHHIQYIQYNPDDVVTIDVGPGAATLIQLDKGETLTGNTAGMGLGDPEAWDVSVRANNIWLRPKAEQPDTNIAMVTTKRTYILRLLSSKTPAWLVKFVYPAPPENPFKPQDQPKLPCHTTPILNLSYQKRGDLDIAPAAVWDDGRFTCMSFPGSRDLPVIYRVTPSRDDPERGTEAQVIAPVEGDTLVVQATGNLFRVRLGDQVAEIRTQALKTAGYNVTGTTTGQNREVIHE